MLQPKYPLAIIPNGGDDVDSAFPKVRDEFSEIYGNLNKIIDGTTVVTNATNATKLSTTRNINGIPFDGTVDITITQTIIASLPTHYQRNTLWAQGSTHTKILPPTKITININDNGYIAQNTAEIDLTLESNWDSITIDYRQAVNRKGKDFYIYACQPADGNVPIFVLSANSTVPTGYTASNSRKIAGFHCLCADVGTITGHTLSGYIAGDILPASFWDLSHRPVSNPEGMVYVDGLDLWVDIYLAGFEGTNVDNTLKLVSKYGVPVADGGSSPEAFHWYKFSQVFGLQKKRMLQQSEFVVSSLGSNQSTNILGSADPITTGGHKDTTNRRMISNYGLEDCCGCHWQWGAEGGGGNTGGALGNAYDVNDKNVGGQQYMAPYKALLGGNWEGGVTCGSRASNWSDSPGFLSAICGSRGASEPQK